MSRADRPKYLLPLLSEQSLLQQTWNRLRHLSAADHILIVAGPAHADEIVRQLPELLTENLIIEPVPRGTAPAIGLAARIIEERDPDAIMGSFAADQDIRDEAAFVRAARTAISAAAEGWLTTIGIEPTRPETGYGYIQRTSEIVLSAEHGDAYRAAGFTEKPDLDTACTFVDSGRYFWNASMFIWSLKAFGEEMQEHLPELWQALGDLAAIWTCPDDEQPVRQIWASLAPVTIDQGLMERSSNIAVVPSEMGWSDVGDWHGLGGLMNTDEHGNALVENVLRHESTGSVVWSTTGRLVALVGVEDMVIVDTPDAMLVVPRDRAQEVRAIVEQLTGEFKDYA